MVGGNDANIHKIRTLTFLPHLSSLSLPPSLLQILAKDYENWSTGDDSRGAVAQVRFGREGGREEWAESEKRSRR